MLIRNGRVVIAEQCVDVVRRMILSQECMEEGHLLLR